MGIGTDGLPGEPEGGPGPHEEPSGDEQDTETCECRNSTSQIDLSLVCYVILLVGSKLAICLYNFSNLAGKVSLHIRSLFVVF